MDNKTYKQANFQESKQETVGHEMRHFIKSNTSIIHKYEWIDTGMNDQESDEKKSGQAHYVFPTGEVNICFHVIRAAVNWICYGQI